MKLRYLAILSLSIGCSSTAAAPDAPVIDSLDVPTTTTTMTLNGQTGPGVVLTLSAHDPSAGINALHVLFSEGNVDQAIAIPGNPTTITAQAIELVIPGAPSGTHGVSLHVTNVNGVSSATIDKTIIVP